MRKRAGQSIKLLLHWIGVGGFAYLSGLLGFVMSTGGGQVYLIWPPTGIAMYALLTWGPRLCPAIWMSSVLLSLSVDSNLTAALAIGVGNTLGPLVASRLLMRVRFDKRFSQLRDYLLFGALGCIVLSTINACIGTATLVLTGEVPFRAADVSWLEWWVGDFLGALLIGPTLFAMFPRSDWNDDDQSLSIDQ